MPRASDIEVDIPGVGLVYFPPEMSMEAIRAKAAEMSKLGLQHQHNVNVEAEAAAQPVDFMGLRPSEIAQVPRMLGMFGGVPGAVLGETAAETIETAGGAREGLSPVEIGAQAAIPLGLKGIGYAAPKVARRLYSSSLKLPASMRPEKSTRIVARGLEEGRIPTLRSIKKSVGTKSEIDQEVNSRLAEYVEREINPEAVAARVEDIRPRFKSATPKADYRTLTRKKAEFISEHGQKPGPDVTVIDEFGQPVTIKGPPVAKNIPLLEAQEIKKGTYKKLGEAAYGELKSAEKESLKALARGLKEELETAVQDVFPELKSLNARSSELFDLNRALVRAQNRISAGDIIGLGIPLKAIAGGKAGLIAGLLDTPAIKARLAVALNKAKVLQQTPVLPKMGGAGGGAASQINAGRSPSPPPAPATPLAFEPPRVTVDDILEIIRQREAGQQ